MFYYFWCYCEWDTFFFPDISLLVYRNTTDFCVILYPATLIHLLISSNSFFWLSLRIFYVSVQFSHSVISDSLRPHGLQHARLPCPSPNPGAYSNSCPLSRWYHPTISSFVVPFSSCFQPFPASGSFLMSQFFALGGQRIGALASTSVFPTNIHDLFLLRLTGLIDSQASSPTPLFNIINYLAHSFLYGPTLTSIHDHWKNHSFR